MTRAKRRHHRDRIKARHMRYWLQSSSWQLFAFPPPSDIATRHPADCGRPRCGTCHYGKAWHGKQRRVRDKAIVSESLA